jgi:CHAT domain-containing protein
LLHTAFDSGLAATRPDATGAAARRLSEKRARLERDLAAHSPAYRQLLAQARRGAAEVRAALPAGATLIDFLEYRHYSPTARGKKPLAGEDRLAAFVVRPGKADVVLVPLGKSARLGELIDAWRASHGRGDVPPRGKPDPAEVLRKELWLKLEKHLGGAKTVLYSPDGPLCRLPLAALPGKKANTFLVHERAFAVVAVPQLLPELLAPRKARSDDQPTLLLVGGVDFGTGRRPSTASGRLPSFPPFLALRGTVTEVNDLKSQFRKAFPSAATPVVLRGGKATRAAFLREADRARYLHLATHGFFADASESSALGTVSRSALLRGVRLRLDVVGRQPELLSGLVFAGVNDPTVKPEDCVLTALEASELNLDGADLVTLSACETGLGKTAGGEGLLGLQRAFQLAGARSVLASLWTVPDESTRQLMAEFYRRTWSTNPLARAEALRQAQLAMLRRAARETARRSGGPEELPLPSVEGEPTRSPLKFPPRRGDGRSPHFWAAFILSGDWR